MFVCFSSNAVELRNDVDNDDDDNDGCVRGQMVKKRLSRFFLLMSRWKKNMSAILKFAQFIRILTKKEVFWLPLNLGIFLSHGF